MKNIHILSGRLGNEMFRHAYLYAQVRDGVLPDVYLQDEKYFSKYADEIKKLFGEGIGYLSQVGVHVRRADNPINPDEPKYSENPFYADLCSSDYYERAMAMFPGEKFVIYSDDPEYCRERFKGENIQVMDKGDEVEDFNLLASSKHLIVANSSFSYWAAYLCPNESKKIVAPKNCFSDGVQRTKLPDEWIQI